jgi:hypothetical protein
VRTRDPESKRSAAAVKRRDRLHERFITKLDTRGGMWNDAPPADSRPWRCVHPECLTFVRLSLRSAGRTKTVPPISEILHAHDAIRELHPEPRFPIRKALAWRFGISVAAVRKALRDARRSPSHEDQEFAIQHPDGTMTDLELWEDLLSTEDFSEVAKVARKPPTKTA